MEKEKEKSDVLIEFNLNRVELFIYALISFILGALCLGFALWFNGVKLCTGFN